MFIQALALERQAQERIMKAVDDATKRQRLLMQRQETERRIMGREEERMRRCQELTRRVVEKPHRDFQEKGHRLYHHAIAHSTYAPGMCACGCCSCSCWFVCCFSHRLTGEMPSRFFLQVGCYPSLLAS